MIKMKLQRRLMYCRGGERKFPKRDITYQNICQIIDCEVKENQSARNDFLGLESASWNWVRWRLLLMHNQYILKENALFLFLKFVLYVSVSTHAQRISVSSAPGARGRRLMHYALRDPSISFAGADAVFIYNYSQAIL
jgi:hypothetical protein